MGQKEEYGNDRHDRQLHAAAGAALGAGIPGGCASDIESSTGAAEMAALYREVYQAASVVPSSGRLQPIDVNP